MCLDSKPYLISACLAGKKCRYDGNSNLIPELKKLCDEGKALMVCPEELGGLPTPRPPAEIIDTANGKRVFTSTGEDVTEAFKKGANLTLSIAQENHVNCAILKSRSPSCGSGYVYDGTFTRAIKQGDGLSAELLEENGIQIFSELNYELVKERQ